MSTAPTIAATVKHGDRIAVHVSHYRGGLSDYADNFTVGSVAGYAAENGHDVDEWVTRAVRLGHVLYYAFNEGVTITAHRQEPVERIALNLGDVIEFDGKLFELVEEPNRNIGLRSI